MLRSILKPRVPFRHVCQARPPKLFHRGQAQQTSQQPPKTANEEAGHASKSGLAGYFAVFVAAAGPLGVWVAYLTYQHGLELDQYQRDRDQYQRERDQYQREIDQMLRDTEYKNSKEHQIKVVKNLFAQKLEFSDENFPVHFDNAELTDLLKTGPRYLVLHGPSNTGKTAALEQHLAPFSGILRLNLRSGREKERSDIQAILTSFISKTAGIEAKYVDEPINIIVEALESVLKDVKDGKEDALGPSPFHDKPVVWIEDLHRCTSEDGKSLDIRAERLMNWLVEIVKKGRVRIIITISTKSGISILEQLSGTSSLMKFIHFPSPDADDLKAGLTDYLVENEVPTKFKKSEEGVVSEKDVAEELVRTYGTFMGHINQACHKIIDAHKASKELNKELNMEKLLEDTRMSLVETEVLRLPFSPEMLRLCDQLQHFEMTRDPKPVYGLSREFLFRVEDSNKLIEVEHSRSRHVTLRNRLQADVAREFLKREQPDTWTKRVVDHSGGVAVAIGCTIVGAVMYYWN